MSRVVLLQFLVRGVGEEATDPYIDELSVELAEEFKAHLGDNEEIVGVNWEDISKRIPTYDLEKLKEYFDMGEATTHTEDE